MISAVDVSARNYLEHLSTNEAPIRGEWGWVFPCGLTITFDLAKFEVPWSIGAAMEEAHVEHHNHARGAEPWGVTSTVEMGTAWVRFEFKCDCLSSAGEQPA